MSTKFLAKERVDILGGWISEFDETGQQSHLRKVPRTHEECMRDIKYRSPVNNVTLLINRATYLDVGGYRSQIFLEDYDLIIRMVLNGSRIANLQKVLVNVRFVPETIHRRRGFKRLLITFRLLDQFRDLGINKMHEHIKLAFDHTVVKLEPSPIKGIVYKYIRRNGNK